jgi:hypothetical protein
MTGDQALETYANQIGWVAASVAAEFGGKIEEDDLRQEASVLVLSYAGAVKGTHYGKIGKLEQMTGNDASQVQKLLARTLHQDLRRIAGRLAGRELNTTSLEDIAPGDEPSYTIDAPVAANISARALRRRYPTLVRHFLDGYSVAEIAEQGKTTVGAVKMRIAREKAKMARDYGMDQEGQAAARDAFGLAA